jgi:putative DNA primase/helicase
MRALPSFGEPEPLPNDLPSVDQFDPWVLPRALTAWVVDIAERIQCPMDFPAVAAMVALASVLGRKVGIRPKRCDDWLVVANLWGALIGRPGVMKTPPLQEATRSLKRLEIAAKEASEAEKAHYEAQKMVFEEKKKTVQQGIKKELRDNDEDGALAIAQEVVESEPKKPIRRRYIVNDSTVEKLGEILNENPNGVLVLRDELIGQLRNLDKEGQESARAFYLEAWNGTGRFTYDRIGRGTVDIEAAIVSVLGSIQPGPLGSYLREAVEGGHGDDGLVSRFQLAVWPDPSPEWRNVDRWPDTAAKTNAYGVFTWIDKLTFEDVGAERDQEDDDSIPYLRFDARAQKVFDCWRGGLERRLRSGEEHPALESHFSKYRSLIPSLSLLIHLADGGKGSIGVETLRKALAWARYLSSHARRIYAVAVMDDVAAAKRLAARIQKGEVKDGFTERDVYRNDWSGLDRDAVRKAVAVLAEYGWVAIQVVQTEGRSKAVVRINPRILKGASHPTDKADGSQTASAEAPAPGTDDADRRGLTAGSERFEPPESHGGPTDRADGSLSDSDWEVVP